MLKGIRRSVKINKVTKSDEVIQAILGQIIEP